MNRNPSFLEVMTFENNVQKVSGMLPNLPKSFAQGSVLPYNNNEWETYLNTK